MALSNGLKNPFEVAPPVLPTYKEWFNPLVTVRFQIPKIPASSVLSPELQALIRQDSVTFGAEKDPLATQLKMTWDYTMSRTSSADQGRLSIYNMSKEFRTILSTGWAQSQQKGQPPMFLSLFLGWFGLNPPPPGPVKLGEVLTKAQIYHVLIDERQGVDVVSHFDFGDGNNNIRDATRTKEPTLGSALGETALTRAFLDALVEPLNVRVPEESYLLFEEAIATFPLKAVQNYTFNLDTSDACDELIDSLGLEWKIFQNEFILMYRGRRRGANLRTPILSPTSGLLDASFEDDDGLKILALANPSIAPGSTIIVQDKFAKPIGAPVHRVSECRFFGNNQAESLMEISARKMPVGLL